MNTSSRWARCPTRLSSQTCAAASTSGRTPKRKTREAATLSDVVQRGSQRPPLPASFHAPVLDVGDAGRLDGPDLLELHLRVPYVVEEAVRGSGSAGSRPLQADGQSVFMDSILEPVDMPRWLRGRRRRARQDKLSGDQ